MQSVSEADMRIRPALRLGEPFCMVVQPAYQRETIGNVNLKKRQTGMRPQAQHTSQVQPARPQPAVQPSRTSGSVPPVRPMQIPDLKCRVGRGQKTQLFSFTEGKARQLQVCFGWNAADARCDMDASAFLLTDDMRVPSDDWFVFYGQPKSPDGSVVFHPGAPNDREMITVDLGRLDRRITRIVFVVTMDEAMEKHLHFGMVKDVYMRILDQKTGREIVSFMSDAQAAGVTSLTLGELYLRGDFWRLNPVGNGVKQDLAGQCAIYGVQIC